MILNNTFTHKKIVQVLKISVLKVLNLKPNYIYESIVSTYTPEDKLPHAAPMGIIFLDEQHLIISPFVSTQTYQNIKNSMCAVVNFTYDLRIFFESTFSDTKPKLPINYFAKAPSVKAPALKAHKAPAFLEVRVQELEVKEDRAVITCEIINWGFERNSLQPINRGFNLVLESMIHATRILAFQNDAQKTKPLRELINRYQKVIEKVSPGGKCVEIMEQIQNIIK